MTYCKDNITCLHQALVCDGYVHCPDGSDEDEDACKVCPRAFGHRSDNPLAAYACKHRYTGLWICAVPCDDHDDLCEGNQDEKCNEGSKYTTLIAGFLLLAVVVIGESFLSNLKVMKSCEVLIGDYLKARNYNDPKFDSFMKIICYQCIEENIPKKYQKMFQKV